jgi:hypothetical protein
LRGFEVNDEEDLAVLADEWIAVTVRRNRETGDLKDTPPLKMDKYNAPAHALIDLIMCDPNKAFHVVEHILSKTSDPWVLENLGAGPLEDLLQTGDEAAIARVNTLAEKYPNAREALSHVWLSHFPPQSRDAVSRILSGGGAPSTGSRKRT